MCQTSMNMNLLGTYDYTTAGNDIWGWVDTTTQNEYALVGLSNGFSCVNVTDPANPFEEFFISDLNSVWRDIKTWRNYAYVTTEADAGLLIVDLNDLTGNTYWHINLFTNPTTLDSVSFTAAHNLYIDENGICYIFGASSANGSNPSDGAIFLDLAANPLAPVYLGEWDDAYIHDGMVRGDTMWAGCIYQGRVYAIDVSNKSNPTTLGSHATPNAFTHNVWVSDNGDYIFTTDEQSGAYLTAYDVSDMNNIQEVDRVQSNPGSGSIPHNTHVDGNFLITSYYRDGTTVHDITYPEHMTQVAYYDSFSGSGNGFEGCWGTFPFLPSGNIISSDRDSGPNGNARLLIYERDFQQASFLSGRVVDANTGLNINNASVEITASSSYTTTNLLGNYTLSSVDDGPIQVLFSASGYIPVTLSFTLTSGIITLIGDVLLSPAVPITGCTDTTATNYDPNANIDDGSCILGSCTDLFFSEYVEGSGMNKALEIYNPTQNIIDLSNYTIERFANGANNSLSGGVTYLSGTILPGDVFVITNGDTDTSSQFGFVNPNLYALGDFAEPNGSYPTPLHFNGNDALTLMKNGSIIDVIGRIGEDPGIAWSDDSLSGYVSGFVGAPNSGTLYTANRTIIRKFNVTNGDQNGFDLFNPSLEWDTMPLGYWGNLGVHNSLCNTSFSNIYGCMDPLAANYNFSANVDDGSCYYFANNPGCFALADPLQLSETIIGTTTYDLQTNASVQNRIVVHNDGTISAGWTMSQQYNTIFSDRGTGYNFFDGNSWGSLPFSRLESSRGGWPSIISLGNGSECAITHNTDNSYINNTSRLNIGFGSWNESIVTPDHLIWNRSVAGGLDGNTLHMIGITASSSFGGVPFNGLDGALVYYRSQDGGLTWDITNMQLPGMDSSMYYAMQGDAYAIAAKDETVVVAYFDDWGDSILLSLILMEIMVLGRRQFFLISQSINMLLMMD